MRRNPVFKGLVVAVIFSACGASAWAEHRHHGLIIRCDKPCDAMAAAVRDAGGTITHEYANIGALAAALPEDRVAEITALAGPNRAFKDVLVAPPAPVGPVAGSRQRGVGVASVLASEAHALDEPALKDVVSQLPKDYAFNNALIGASAFHANGQFGQGVITAVIDTGTTNSLVVPTLFASVIGGESFVTGDPVASATSRNNGPHGTWVGTVIAGHAAFGFLNNSTLIQSLKLHAPGAIIGACPDPPTAAVCAVPILGVAPLSSIYALKVFDSRGGGAPESTILAAMDRAITLKRNFNNGMPSTPVSGTGAEDDPFVYNSLNIQVANMSLGGPTLFAGRDVEDELTREMVKVGITLAASAGNDGFAAMTGGSPGTGFGALTVGAASTPAHERVLRDVQFGLGIGALYRPFDEIQTAFFSSRGPTADGRFDPELTANGFATFAEGTCQGSPACIAGTGIAPVSFVSGTSFSSPTVAGAAALLRQVAPTVSAGQIRNALARGANPNLLGDGSGRIDQGRGFLDVTTAAARLAAGISGEVPQSLSTPIVAANLALLGFKPVKFVNDVFKAHVKDLLPGQAAQFFVDSDIKTDRLVVKLSNVTPELPPSQQNQLFGDDLFVMVADAPTSFLSPLAISFIAADTSIPIDNPQTGLVRVALQGDWTNAGRISADVRIERVRKNPPLPTAIGLVRQGDLVPIQFEVPAGTAELVVELGFLQSWAIYPTNDVDVVLQAPGGALNFDGATLSSPERVVINAPTPGVWTAIVQGFTIQFNQELWALTASADGVRLRKK
jgi:subtilisin family serine protease